MSSIAGQRVAAGDEEPPPLRAYLASQLGTWPPTSGFTVALAPARSRPGWDGRVRPVMGVSTPAGTVVGVTAELYDKAAGASSAEDLVERLGGRIGTGIMRWTVAPTPMEPLGTWVPADDPSVPEWLHPFGGDVLIERDDDGAYMAGVGLKRHDDNVWEISVGTEEAARGKGLARRLVVTAAQSVIDAGRTPTYLHDPSNHASAKVAEASGFVERGWRILFHSPS